MTRVLVFALLLDLVTLVAPYAPPASGVTLVAPVRLCTRPPSTPDEIAKHRRDAFNQAAAVFTAEVTQVERVTVRMAMDRIWKGEPNKEVTLLTGLPPDVNVWVEDVFTFAVGRRYVIFAYRTAFGGLTTNLCTRTALLEGASDEIQALDAIVASRAVK